MLPIAFFSLLVGAILIAAWSAFAVVFGGVFLWIIRRTIAPDAAFYTWGLFGVVLGAAVFRIAFIG